MFYFTCNHGLSPAHLTELKWLPVCYSIQLKFEICLPEEPLVYSLYLSVSLIDQRRRRLHVLRSADTDNYPVQSTRTKFQHTAFYVAGPPVWNSLAHIWFKRLSEIEPFTCILVQFYFDLDRILHDYAGSARRRHGNNQFLNWTTLNYWKL